MLPICISFGYAYLLRVQFRQVVNQKVFMDTRQQAIRTWLQAALPLAKQPVLIHGDASFRRYFRVHSENKHYILMDAPPKKEACKPYIAITNAFRALGLHTPEIYRADLEQGFLLITDFGDCTLLSLLNSETADRYYQTAFDYLLTIQACEKVEPYTLPLFDANLYQKELHLFREWYLQRHLDHTLSRSDSAYLDHMDALLIEDALAQPQVCVHRDYHSRNLMVLENEALGILDFQDAVRGPITYDLMSLLRDCYIEWPFDRVQSWALAYHQLLLQHGRLSHDDPEQFLRWCDWIALQRHLKCIGIFARLHYRDHKSEYLNDIPRVIRYAKMICQRYPEFAELEKILG